MLDSSDETMQRLADFEALRSQQIEIPFTESGWLRFERNSHGHIIVRYRIGGWKASAAIEGEVAVEGEFADSFRREFRALLKDER
jgi:hypothetical protein